MPVPFSSHSPENSSESTLHSEYISVHVYDQTIAHLTHQTKNAFQKAISAFDMWLGLLLLCVSIELVCALSFATSPFLLGISLSLLFISLFGFFIFMRFLEEKKEVRARSVLDTFLKEMKTTFSTLEGDQQASLITSCALIDLAAELEGMEKDFFSETPLIKSLGPSPEKWSTYLHFRDVLMMQMWLLEEAALSLIELIKKEPLSTEYHKRLAEVHLRRAHLFQNSLGLTNDESNKNARAHLNANQRESISAYYTASLNQAVEELLIVVEQEPESLWVHEQLLECYGALDMEEDQMEKADALFQLAQNSSEVLLMLGIMYFEKSRYAKGLEIYAKLQSIDPKAALELIEAYTLPQTKTL